MINLYIKIKIEDVIFDKVVEKGSIKYTILRLWH